MLQHLDTIGDIDCIILQLELAELIMTPLYTAFGAEDLGDVAARFRAVEMGLNGDNPGRCVKGECKGQPTVTGTDVGDNRRLGCIVKMR